jgi:hypothetical protein
LVRAKVSLSKYIHPLLHKNKLNENRFVGWLHDSKSFRAIQRYHFNHHNNPRHNFNLLIGGDFIFLPLKEYLKRGLDL